MEGKQQRNCIRSTLHANLIPPVVILGFKIAKTKFCQGIIGRKYEKGTKVLIKGKHILVLKIKLIK